ncbi:SCO2522 family protein [Streptomyces sp. NPDC029041]|uniref:SCO2522 family protein n=1 Tax=Streptomyces sp. NPDC029041 TaxID=3155727 RepID=UPI0033CE2E8B
MGVRMTGRGGDADPVGQEADWSYGEGPAKSPTQAVPYSHLSLELGHLYLEDLAAGPEKLRAHFTQVAPWAETATRALAGRIDPAKLRVSTCLLIDDYFSRSSSPAEVIPRVTGAAARAGLRVDYIARESGCATAEGVDVAALLLARLVAPPSMDTEGGRPPVTQSGWLPNGTRSPYRGTSQAMSPVPAWQPPLEFGAARRHSVFLDAELWTDGPGGTRRWSCPFLGAVWQMLRLGLLRHHGAAVVPARTWPDGTIPDEWDSMPPLVKLDQNAAPFCAYRTFSVLGSRFLPVEHAVRVILDHTVADPDALAQAAERGERESVFVPPGLAERVMYAFIPSDGASHGDMDYAGGVPDGQVGET